MRRARYLLCVWSLIMITHTGAVMRFLEKSEGDSVVLPCAVDHTGPPAPYGVYLMRSWLRPSKVLFMHTQSEFTMEIDDDQHRTSVSGDPSGCSLNVTISELRAADTDRYYCEFVVENPSSADDRLRGRTEFFLLVKAGDAPGPAGVGLVETCSGGSVVLPCLPPGGEGLAVDGVSLRRQRGREGPVEVVYDSKRHHESSGPPSSSSSSSSSSSFHFSAERVLLSSAPGPGGISYQLSLQQLQPEDSGLYSCQLLLRGGRTDSSTGLGKQVDFVSVQGQCVCPGYSNLLYALSSAVAFLLLLFLIGAVVIYKGKTRRRVKSSQQQQQAPIYEEMTGVKPRSGKLASEHLEEAECSEYTNCHVKKSCPPNHYEIPIGGLGPRGES